MKQFELLEEARRQVTPSEVDAFVKGANWLVEKFLNGDGDIIIEDMLPSGSIVLERFRNGSPKIVLGPNLGFHYQYEAIKIADNGLWRLPTIEQLRDLRENHIDVFLSLHNIGEDQLVTRSKRRNMNFINPLNYVCKSGSSYYVYSNDTKKGATRAILDLSDRYNDD